jgi:chromate transporter
MHATRPITAEPLHDLPSRRQALAFWAKLGCISFGGPAGQIALMHAELVERRRWLSESRFLHALNYCMLLPGPEAQQLATYCGWLLHGRWGGVAAGLLFILPSLLLMIGLGWAYMVLGAHPLAQGLLYGIQPAVIALILQAGWRLGNRTLKAPLHRLIALGSLVAVVVGVSFPLVLLVAAVLGLAFDRSVVPPELGPLAVPPSMSERVRALLLMGGGGLVLGGAVYGLLLASGHPLLSTMARFFTQVALLTFGGAYAVLPYVMQAAVEVHGWVTAQQMLTALALGESTPGPLIMVLSFVGFVGGWQQPMFDSALASGVAAALVVTFFTFLPSFVFILAGAPWIEATHGLPRLAAPLRAISAAVVGVIAQLGLVLALHVLWPDVATRGSPAHLDWPALLIGCAAALALMRSGRGVFVVLAGSALAGLLVQAIRA